MDRNQKIDFLIAENLKLQEDIKDFRRLKSVEIFMLKERVELLELKSKNAKNNYNLMIKKSMEIWAISEYGKTYSDAHFQSDHTRAEFGRLELLLNNAFKIGRGDA